MKYLLGIIAAALLFFVGWHVMDNTHMEDEHGHNHEDGHTLHEVDVWADGSLSIATSFYPLQFALERIIGDLGTVTNIGEGRDPHDFKPSAQDILTLQQADVVVLQGADFEPWGDDVMEQLEADEVPVVIATADIELHEGGHHDEHGHDDEAHEDHEDDHADEEDEHGHAHGAFDPHTWLDPVLFSETVAHLAESLATVDLKNAATYEANAKTLQAELAELDAAYTARLSSCTIDEVITSHDAFGYLGDRYEIEIHAIGGLSTQDIPSATTLAELKEEAEEGVGAILLEENSIAAYGETLARETGLQTLSINPVAYVIPEGENYLTLMRANLDTLATALSCNE